MEGRSGSVARSMSAAVDSMSCPGPVSRLIGDGEAGDVGSAAVWLGVVEPEPRDGRHQTDWTGTRRGDRSSMPTIAATCAGSAREAEVAAVFLRREAGGAAELGAQVRRGAEADVVGDVLHRDVRVLEQFFGAGDALLAQPGRR
ncbi:MAG TPA: hypothetical protein VFU65_00565 [Actinocrinis sp.]|nr:hypothetical protein [Actinocrinis sp.]